MEYIQLINSLLFKFAQNRALSKFNARLQDPVQSIDSAR